MSEPTKVIKLSEHEGAFADVQETVRKLSEQMKSDQNATKLSIEERADDMVKYLAVVEDIAAKAEMALQESHKARRAAAIVSGSIGLATEIERLGAGFRMPAGVDEDFKRVKRGEPVKLKNLVEGVLLKDGTYFECMQDDVQRLQELNDSALVLDTILRTGPESQSYLRAGGMKSLEIMDEIQHLAEMVGKAAGDLIDTVDIVNWVPEHFSAGLYSLIKIGLPELELFPEIIMPGATYRLPIDLTDTEAILLGETTTVTAANPFADTDIQTLTDAKTVLDAQKFRARILTSKEAEEDAMIAILPLIREQLVRMIREAKADALINGQKTASIDTGLTHFGKANPPSGVATDARNAWNGLRYLASVNTSTPSTQVDAGDADASVAAMRNVRAAMGEFGATPQDMAWIYGLFGYTQLLNEAQVITVDKIGPSATVLTGSLGMVDGVNLLVSRRMPQNMDAAGIISSGGTGFGTRTTALLVHTRGFIRGSRRRMTAGMSEYGATDSRDLYVFDRSDFQPLYGNAYPAIGELYNIAAD